MMFFAEPLVIKPLKVVLPVMFTFITIVSNVPCDQIVPVPDKSPQLMVRPWFSRTPLTVRFPVVGKGSLSLTAMVPKLMVVSPEYVHVV